LRFFLPFDRLRAGYLLLMVSSLSNHARLACGAFYGAAELGFFFNFLRVHQHYILGVNGKVKVYQFRELKSVPPIPLAVVI